MVGKYVDLTESYKSLNEALYHAGFAHRARVVIEYFDSEKLDDASVLSGVDGILVPHGFGSRGAEGKVVAVRCARELRIPYFGICYGMQLAVIEYARHVAGLDAANSREIDPATPNAVIDLMPEQRGVEEKGATMRLGAWPCVLRPGTRAYEAYGTGEIDERHRHRYEFNNDFRDALTAAGLVLSGTSPDGRLVEIVEVPDHPWFLGCQFHPEFASTPFRPHPLFVAFVAAAMERAGER
jgi:CTP synthase